MKNRKKLIMVMLGAMFFIACNTTQGLPNPEVMENHGGDMGGGTGTGVMGDDPKMPEKNIID